MVRAEGRRSQDSSPALRCRSIRTPPASRAGIMPLAREDASPNQQRSNHPLPCAQVRRFEKYTRNGGQWSWRRPPYEKGVADLVRAEQRIEEGIASAMTEVEAVEAGLRSAAESSIAPPRASMGAARVRNNRARTGSSAPTAQRRDGRDPRFRVLGRWRLRRGSRQRPLALCTPEVTRRAGGRGGERHNMMIRQAVVRF